MRDKIRWHGVYQILSCHATPEIADSKEKTQMSSKEELDWWDNIPAHIEGDVIIGHQRPYSLARSQ